MEVSIQEYIRQMQDTQARFIIFIDKLKERLEEFAKASIPELVEMNAATDDDDKMSFHRMKSAVLGQLEGIRKKAREVQKEKVSDFYFDARSVELTKAYYQFRTICYSKTEELEELYNYHKAKIEATYREDYEAQYRAILDEYEAIKDRFKCIQCGGPIHIDKIYFTTTYITCGSCQTKNTFEPSTQAKGLEHLGRSLAEQRTEHLLDEYKKIPSKTKALYLQRHQLELSLHRELDPAVKQEKEKQIAALLHQQNELEASAPVLYQKYLRAMFDEWNKINPMLKDEHEKFYLRSIKENQNIKL